MKLYTIYDEKAESYGNPFSALNDKVAIRIFEDASNDPSTQIHHHKEDFILYGLANYNRDNGRTTQAINSTETRVDPLTGPNNKGLVSLSVQRS